MGFWPHGGAGDVFSTDTKETLRLYGHGGRIIFWHTCMLRRDSVLFTDSHFTSPLSFDTLKEKRGIFACGTCDFQATKFPFQELPGCTGQGRSRGFTKMQLTSPFPSPASPKVCQFDVHILSIHPHLFHPEQSNSTMLSR